MSSINSNQMPSIQNIPQEVFIKIFSYLSDQDLRIAACVCKEWDTFANDQPLWRTLAFERWGRRPKNEPNWKAFYRETSSPSFINKLAIRNNWFAAENRSLLMWEQEYVLYPLDYIPTYKLKTYETAHKAAITSLAVFAPSSQTPPLIATGSKDGQIKIWNCQSLAGLDGQHQGNASLQEIQSIDEHERAITSLRISNGVLFSGSADHSIRIWNMKDGKFICSKILTGHQGAITCLVIPRNDQNIVVFSGSTDRTIRRWEIKEDTDSLSITNFGAHDDTITCLAYDSFVSQKIHLISGDQLGKIKIWSIAAGSPICAKEFQAHESRITCLLWDREKSLLFTGSEDKKIKVWTADKQWKLRHLFEEHKDAIIDILHDPGKQPSTQKTGYDPTLENRMRLISISKDKGICVWTNHMDPESLECIYKSPQ